MLFLKDVVPYKLIFTLLIYINIIWYGITAQINKCHDTGRVHYTECNITYQKSVEQCLTILY